MEKLFKYFKYISIIASIIFFICLVVYLGYGIKGKVFLKVDNDNKNFISEMCETDGISLDSELSQIGYKQCLGDWELYLQYKDGNSDWHLLKDTIGADLRTYIRENGQLGGTGGIVANYLMKISASVVGICIVCILGYKFRKKDRLGNT